MYNKLTCLVLALLVFFSACSGDPNEKANELYVNASQKVKRMTEVQKGYSNVLEIYRDARNDIELILSKHNSSNLAVSLSSGQTRIGNFTMTEFMELENALAPLAKAEQDPLSCAVLVAEDADKYDEKARLYARIATIYAKKGQKENADQFFSQAAGAAEKIGDEYDRISALVGIAGNCLESGYNDKAIPILDQALGRLMDSAGRNDGYFLSMIASKYAEAGQVAKSMEVGESILEREYYRALPLAKVAGIVAQAGEKDRAKQLLSQALDATKTFKNEHTDIDEIFEEIAFSYAKADMFSTAFEVADKMTDDDKNVLKIGRIHIMKVQLKEAAETAGKIESNYYKSQLLSEIAAAYAETGNDDKSAEFFSRSLDTAKALSAELKSDGGDMDNAYGIQAALYTAIAGNCSKAGMKEQAGQLLAEAVAITDKIKGDAYWELVRIASKYVEGDINPNQNDVVFFSNFVEKVHPMNLFWDSIHQN